MASWSTVATEHPELTGLVDAAFAARRLKTLATLRRDGTPRLSEISGAFLRDGEAWLGIIPSAKARDLDRDPRCAVHCGSPTDEWGVSARFSGRAVPVDLADMRRLGFARDAAAPTFRLFRVDLSEVTVARPDPETGQILVEWWAEAGGAGRVVRPGG